MSDFVAGADGPLADYYRHRVDPPRSEPWYRGSYLVLDVESTAVDPDEGHLLSMGWVCMDDGAIDAGSARHHLIRPPTEVEVGQSAVVHHITDTEALDGDPAGDVVEALLADLRGRILVCHFAQIELGFLSKVCRHFWGIGFWPWYLVDTMQWHFDRARRAFEPDPASSVRLYALMEHYGLPATRAHHALSDAYGTAMLLMAMAGGMPGNGSRDGGRGRGQDEAVRTIDDLLDSRSWS